MSVWNSWTVLATLVVITQSFPHPDKEYKIPEVPAGKRVQYYVLHDDGDYKYGFDTGVGAYERAVRMGGDLSGFFGFNNALGQNVRVDYTAGAEGFNPTISETSGSATAYSSQPVSSAASHTATAQQTAFRSAVESTRPFEEAKIDSVHNLDGSYSFAYQNSDSARQEKADASNNVVGRFSFVADGENHEVNYRAGAGIGYVPDGVEVPEVPAVQEPAVQTLYSAPASVGHSAVVDEAFIPRGDASYSFNYQTDDASRSETSDSDLNVKGQYSFVGNDGVQRRVNYVAGSETGFVATGSHLPSVAETSGSLSGHGSAASAVQYAATSSGSQAPAEISISEPSGDASYSFSYKTDDSSRSETADSDLNVRGEYSFVADDGEQRRVNYVAGSATGFVASGSHLPKPVESSSSAVQYSSASAVQHSAAPAAPITYDAGAVSKFEPRGDASYSFSYNTGESARAETADADLNVKGQYSFVADDGVERKVDYVAGSETGFVASGSHLPVEGASPQQYSVAGAAHGATQGVAHVAAVQYSAPSVSSTGGAHAQISQTGPSDDASYSFSYNTGDSYRSETADADLNVKGEYSFVADDGAQRKVNYIAGSETGFVATGSHLPEAVDASAAAPAVQYSAPTVGVQDGGAAQAQIYRSEPTGDASYSFSYQTGDSSRSETADADLSVKGQYSFVADDGVNRHVNYIAGSETGFVATGDHLPSVADASSSAASATQYSASAAARPGFAAERSGFSGQQGAVATFKSSIASSGSEHRDALIDSTKSADGSYQFSYINKDSARSESADGDNNVQGEYSFVTDGESHHIKYKAGSGIGFVLEGNDIPLVSAAASPVVTATQYKAPTVHSTQYSASSQIQSDVPRNDASYSFSYNADESSRNENADADLNVKGQFSFVADDGEERTVHYIAGSETGFVASGAHLPVPPVDGGAAASGHGSGAVQATFKAATSSAGHGAHAGSSFKPTAAVSAHSASQGGAATHKQVRTYSASSGHPKFRSDIIGDVLLNQYGAVPGNSNFGYVFTQV